MAVYGNDSEEAWKMIEGLMANKMIIQGSSSACFKNVADGEYVVGLTYEDGASTLLKSGATNIRLVYPASGSSNFAFGCAVVKTSLCLQRARQQEEMHLVQSALLIKMLRLTTSTYLRMRM